MIFFYFIIFFFIINLSIYLNHNKLKLLGIPFDNPDKVRIFALRSFGESLYHSITDASLEFGYRSI